MNWKSWLVLFLFGIGLLCTSCAGEETQNATLVGVEEAAISDDEEGVGSSEVEASEEEVVIEPEPTATLAPTATPRSILMQDDFSDISSGWERYREFDGVLDYVEDEEHYQMLVQADDSLWWVWLEEELARCDPLSGSIAGGWSGRITFRGNVPP